MAVVNVVWRQWSDQYVSMTRSSVTVGARCSVSRKYAWQNFRSSKLIAKPISSMNACSPASSRPLNCSSTLTSAGGVIFISSDAGFSSDASRLSTLLMQYALISSNVSRSTSPTMTMTRAVRISGRSFAVTSCTHCAAESAVTSYCPGRYSMANTREFGKCGSFSS